MIEVKQLTKCYDKGRVSALEDVSFKMRNRKIYGLLGPKGAGKSTVLGIMAGAVASTEGTVLINGYDICRQPMEAKRQIGYLPEHPPVFKDMTPYEYLMFVASVKGVKGETAVAQVKEALAVTDLASVEDHLICHLTPGCQRRIGLAQALLGNPDVLILDEPLADLDPVRIAGIKSLIRKLGQTKTVIVSGHVLAEIKTFCDHIIILSEGKVVADDVPEVLEAGYGKNVILSVTVQGDAPEVRRILCGLQGVQSVTELQASGEEAVFRVVMDGALDAREAIVQAMTEAEFRVLRMDMKEQSLEDAFMTLSEQAEEVASADYEEEREAE